MVICDGALVVNLVASIMMNGVCCIHSMHEEEEKKREHREALQKTIHVEWQRQRLFEKELQQQEQLKAVHVQERRRSLMTAKLQASSTNNLSHRDESSMRDSYSSGPSTTSLRSSLKEAGRSSHFIESPAMIMAQRRIRSEPVHALGSTRRFPQRRGYESDMSSLMDNDDDDDEVNSSFVDVALQ